MEIIVLHSVSVILLGELGSMPTSLDFINVLNIK